MGLLRFFQKHLVDHEDRLALEILYDVIDHAKLTDTDSIYKKKELIEVLADAIRSVISYQYIESDSTNSKIKTLVSEKLFKAAQKYPASNIVYVKDTDNDNKIHVSSISGHKSQIGTFKNVNLREKGLDYNYQCNMEAYASDFYAGNKYGNYVAKEIAFPEALFLKKDLLKDTIINALETENNYLLIQSGRNRLSS